MTTLYRYEDDLADEEPFVRLREFEVVRETAKCYVIDPNGMRSWTSRPLRDWQKFVRKNARKVFAYDTVEKARESYNIRKRNQLGYLSRQYDHVAKIVARLDEGTAYDPLPIPDPKCALDFTL